MLQLKLSRDNARYIEEQMLPLMLSVAEMKIREAERDTHQYFSAKVLHTLLLEVKKLFARKLAGDANKFAFKFNDAQGITFFKFLMDHPIPGTEIFLMNLRNHVVETLHKQI